MNKCENCLFRALYLNVPLCKRETSFEAQARAAKETTPCRWHITKKQVAELQETVNWRALLRGDTE